MLSTYLTTKKERIHIYLYNHRIAEDKHHLARGNSTPFCARLSCLASVSRSLGFSLLSITQPKTQFREKKFFVRACGGRRGPCIYENHRQRYAQREKKIPLRGSQLRTLCT